MTTDQLQILKDINFSVDLKRIITELNDLDFDYSGMNDLQIIIAYYELKPSFEKFARRDSITGLGMSEGWCFGEGDFYCADEENALIYAKELGYNSIEEAYKDEVGYWTTWEEVDEDCYYDAAGNEYNN